MPSFDKGWEKDGCRIFALGAAIILAAVAFVVILIAVDQFLQPSP